ncbi:TRAP transporter large permease [Paracoccus tegillarcae]|uniref:C4-dicarboxylate ABC transporter permease n=1 Tax=Paracoccus tegillarcae TaxID=1529068 RepID=A0A2K9EJE8_9RHOB|nr:TRAP transporter large permease subunit [Paracoccus tegillarcae]AUH33497.1 C4-dicarboxylate ABC transporter permease [Paracoccus tegillarcae]
MDISTISMILLAALFFLLIIGMPLGLASGVLGVAVLFMKFGPELLLSDFGSGPLNIIGQRIYGILTDYVLISVPLFIFMANLLERSGIAAEMYNSLNIWLNRTRGGIAVVTSIMAVIMAAMSGIIGGEVVLLGLIALPQMLRLGYNRNLAIGTICASGSLGTMIPPSIVLIMYGMITETSIKALFTASFVPGFILASFYILYIIIRVRMHPEDAPLPPPTPGEPEGSEKTLLFGTFLLTLLAGATGALALRAGFFTLTGRNSEVAGVDPIALGTPSHLLWLGGISIAAIAFILLVCGRERLRVSWSMGKGMVAPLIVIGVVLGSIYGGVTGITEAAGMGAIAVAVIATIRGEMTVDLLSESLKRTLKATGTILWVTIGATALAGAYTIIGGPNYIASTIIGAEMHPMFVILIMMLIFLILGMFMDWVGIVLLVIPVFLPIINQLPIEQIGFFGNIAPEHLAIWFGVVFCMNMQVSFLSPPFGPAAFYLKSVAPPDISLTDIFKGFLPFIMLQLLALSIPLLWPNIVSLLL